MRAYYILFVVILHTVTATVDLYKLKEATATKLQTLEENAATKLQSLHKRTATKLQNIQEKATESFNQFVDTIDLEKLKKLDILNILPKLQRKGEFIQKTVESLPEYKQKAKLYLQTIKSLTGEDLLLAFDLDVPWPAKRLHAIGMY